MKEKLLIINISGTNSKVKLYENGNISENFEFKIDGYQKGKIIENDSFFESFRNPKLTRVLNYQNIDKLIFGCLLYTSPSPRDSLSSRMPSSA